MSPYFWIAVAAVAIVLAFGNVILERSRAQKAAREAARLALEKQMQDRSQL